ncbi:AAA family ATPase [Paenibacillus lautus]|uniref:phosphotransferase-like protein n=1 Tax=Paenibacillus lautus TaxID=1401 RepID=UPI003D266851
MKRGNIIFLNGVSSSGKTTLAKQLLKRLPDYYHYSIDDFDVVIEQMEDRDNDRLIPVETEYFFHRTIAMFSDKAVNLIIDHVIHDEFIKIGLQSNSIRVSYIVCGCSLSNNRA